MSAISFLIRQPGFPRPAALSLALLAALTAHAAEPSADANHLVDLDRINVVSTATRSERLLSEVPIRTEVVRNEDILLRGGNLDFSRAAELINGLRVESNCQNCNTSDVRLLGLEGGYNQLLFDGAPLLSSLGNVYGIEQIPAVFINRIEVVKGGGSALYGPGAVAGVVNLISQQPTRNGGFAQIGSEWQKGEPMSHAVARIDRVSEDGSAGLSLVGQFSENDAIDFDGDGYTEISEKEMKVIGAQGWYSLGENTTLRANYTFTKEERRGGNRLDQPQWLAHISEGAKTDYHRGGLYWDQIINEDIDFTLGYSFAYVKRESYYGGLGAYGAGDPHEGEEIIVDPNHPDYDANDLNPNFPNSTAADSYNQYGYTVSPLHYLDSQFNIRQGDHALAFGMQYKREMLRDDKRDGSGATFLRGPKERYTNFGTYIQDEWAINDAVDLVLGLRADKASTLDDVVFSPRIAMAWKTNDQWMLRAGISTGFRAPEIFDEDLHVDTIGGTQVTTVNKPDLKEERAITFMLGADWRSDDGRMNWDITGSLTDIKDTFAETDFDPDTGLRTRYNASGSQVLGVETNIGWQVIDTLRFNAGLAWYKSRFDEKQEIWSNEDEKHGIPVATDWIFSDKYQKTPSLTGLAQVAWTPIPQLDTFLGLSYTGRMWVLNNNTETFNHTDDFYGIDIGGVFHIGEQGAKHWDISFGVRNLLDERQKDLESGVLRDNDYVYGPRFARSYYINTCFSF